jgi:hypothetical protein
VSRHIQNILAAAQIARGFLCVAAPSVLFSPGVADSGPEGCAAMRALSLIIGVQAVLCGGVVATTSFSSATFIFFAVLVCPLLAVDYYFYVSLPIFTEVILVDFALNIVVLGLCYWGYMRAAGREGVVR